MRFIDFQDSSVAIQIVSSYTTAISKGKESVLPDLCGLLFFAPKNYILFTSFGHKYAVVIYRTYMLLEGRLLELFPQASEANF
jgi:hypothetical protein